MDTKRCIDWSKLCPDVLVNILETLSPIDQHLAKYVCLDWYSVWKTWVNRPPCPSRIIHQGEDSSKLLTPKGDKIYVRTLVGQRDLNSAYCMASSGNWLLMIGSPLKLYLLNLVTGKRINLPLMDCRDNIWKDILQLKSSASLSIDETRGAYAVAWIFRQRYLFSYGSSLRNYTIRDDDFMYDSSFNSWWCSERKSPDSGFMDVVAYKNGDHVLTTDQSIGDHVFSFDEKPWEYIWKRKIAINKSGEVLIILSLKEVKYEERLLFYVFKMNSESCKWERVFSIGIHEMVTFGQGVTVNAPVKAYGDGIKSDIICFVENDVWPDTQDYENRASDCGIFDLATGRIEWCKKLRYYINKTQWFVPGVAY